MEAKLWLNKKPISIKDIKIQHHTWASYQIRNIAGCACAGNAGNAFPRRRLQRKPLVCDPGMHHGTCVTHVPWCMSGSLAPGGGENVPGIPGACALAIFRIWQEAHGTIGNYLETPLREWSFIFYTFLGTTTSLQKRHPGRPSILYQIWPGTQLLRKLNLD